MRVWENTFISVELRELTIYSGEIFVTNLTKYFDDRDYGKGVDGIFYIMVCENPVFSVNTAGDTFFYDRSMREVQLGLRLDFETASNLDGPQFCRYLANVYLERSLDIEGLNIPEFRLTEYIADLEAFFRMQGIF